MILIRSNSVENKKSFDDTDYSSIFLYSFKSSVFAAEAMVPRSRVIIDTDPVPS